MWGTPLPVLVGGAAVIFLLLGLLIEQDISRNRIESQEEIAARTEDRSRPVLEASAALIDDAHDLTPSVRATAARLRTALRSLPEALDSVQDITVRLPHLISAGSAFLESANQTRIFAQVTDLLARVTREDLVHDGAQAARSVPTLVKLQRKLLRVQQSTYTVIVESRDTQRRLLSTQIEALRHIRSLDRKTGGSISP